MTLELPKQKIYNIYHRLEVILDHISKNKNIRIREFAAFLGSLTAICPAIAYSWLHTKSLERVKYLALLNSNDNYDQFMKIPNSVENDLLWFKRTIPSGYNPIRQGCYQLEIFTDASMTGWGASYDGQHTVVSGPTRSVPITLTTWSYWQSILDLRHLPNILRTASYF